MTRVPAMGYRSLTHAAVSLQGEGLVISEIAKRLNRTEAAIENLLYWNQRAARRCKFKLSRHLVDKLEPEAKKRGVGTLVLIEKILGTALNDDLVGAILDD